MFTILRNYLSFSKFWLWISRDNRIKSDKYDYFSSSFNYFFRRSSTIALTGSKSNKLEKISDIILKVPSNSTQRIQESHILIGHIICEIIKNKILLYETSSEIFKNKKY